MYEIGEAEVDAVRRVFLSKKLFRYQPGHQSECDIFERDFAKKIGVKHAIILSSGTNALVAALIAAGVEPGDEVLVPAYTFVATVAAIRMVGAQPVIVNIDNSLGLSADDAKTKITKRTKAIIPVHMDGLAADLNPLSKLAKKNKLILIEDCAQAIGGSYRDRRLGAIGVVGAFSLNENKNISCGEGGIVVTSDDSIYEKLFCLHDSAARFSPVKKSLFKTPPPMLGMSMRVSELQGAIMRVQLKRLDPILKRLRERKRILRQCLAPLRAVSIISGSDRQGDCASSLHLRFDNPHLAAKASTLLMQSRINAVFPALRPAHVAWKWLDLIDPNNAKEVTAGLLPSINIIMSTLKYDIDFSLTLEETKRLGNKMHDAIGAQ
jgi:dTDP-4-amino-4,6-dideoxygalactose transaminase